MTFAQKMRFAKYTVITAIIVIGGIFAASALPIPGNYKIYTVLSASMEPAISKGSIVFVRPKNIYEVGDIVTATSGNPQRPVTHRISAIEKIDGGKKTIFVTRGDANDEDDITRRTQENVIGAVLMHVPLLGYPVGWVQTPRGFVILIVIPAALIVYHEILTIVSVAESSVRRRMRTRGKQDKKETS